MCLLFGPEYTLNFHHDRVEDFHGGGFRIIRPRLQ